MLNQEEAAPAHQVSRMEGCPVCDTKNKCPYRVGDWVRLKPGVSQRRGRRATGKIIAVWRVNDQGVDSDFRCQVDWHLGRESQFWTADCLEEVPRHKVPAICRDFE